MLGPFEYKPEDFLQPIQTKCDDQSVSVGQFKAGTNALHGIGIRVKKNGSIEEGYWKDGKKDGKGRCIFDSGLYYIGTYKADRYEKGICYKTADEELWKK